MASNRLDDKRNRHSRGAGRSYIQVKLTWALTETRTTRSVLARGESPLRGDGFVIDADHSDEIYAAEGEARYFASKISIGTGLLNK
jgi:hypothetical protein